MVYIKGRVNKITQSLKKIFDTDRLYLDNRIDSTDMHEADEMLIWNINHTILDVKDQIVAELKRQNVDPILINDIIKLRIK